MLFNILATFDEFEVDRTTMAKMDAEMAAFEIGQKAFAEANAALERGELGLAAVQLRVAASPRRRGCVVRLAAVLDRPGDHEAAQAWRAVAEADGHIVEDGPAPQSSD